MKRLFNILCLALITTNVWASDEFTFYNGDEKLPFEKQRIFDFQLTLSSAQYSEEQLAEIKPYTEKRIQQLFELLPNNKVTLLLVTGQEKDLLGACWFRTEGETLLMRQTNASRPDLYMSIAAKLLETQTNVKTLALKVPVARTALLKKVLLDNVSDIKLSAEETTPFPDDDDEFSGNINWSYWHLSRL